MLGQDKLNCKFKTKEGLLVSQPITGIYKITNIINGKVYIGQSVDIKRRWRNHKKEAFYEKSHSYNYPLYCAIRKYGIKNFAFEILEECSKEDLNEKEKYYITEYNTCNKQYGYNQTEGGDSPPHPLTLSESEISEILHRLKTTLDNTSMIGDDYGVSYSTIRDINVGKVYRRDSEVYPIRPNIGKLCEDKDNGGYKIKEPKIHTCRICGAQVWQEGNLRVTCQHLRARKIERPEPLTLAKMIKENGFEQTGKIFNVSGNAIKRWCDEYKIPRHKAELIAWYNQQMGIINVPKTEEIKRKSEEVVRPVKQIDITTGKVLNVFSSQAEAIRHLEAIDAGHIGEVCKGKRKSAYGFYWEWADI